MLVTSTYFSTSTAYASVTASASTSNPASLNDGSGASRTGFFAKTGAVAGVFTVVGLVAAALLVALGLFYFRRKRARALDEDIRVAAGGAGAGGAGTSRFRDDEWVLSFLTLQVIHWISVNIYSYYSDPYDGSDETGYGPKMSQYSSSLMIPYGDEPNSAQSHNGMYQSNNNRASLAPSSASIGTAGIAGIGGAAMARPYEGYNSSQSNYDIASSNDHQSHHNYSSNAGGGYDEPAHAQWGAYVNSYGDGPPSPPHRNESNSSHGSANNKGALAVDQRLNPRAMLEQLRNKNSSHSLVDDHECVIIHLGADTNMLAKFYLNSYSRQLRVANPSADGHS